MRVSPDGGGIAPSCLYNKRRRIGGSSSRRRRGRRKQTQHSLATLLVDGDTHLHAWAIFLKKSRMFKNTFQSGFLSILYSIGSKPLQIWEKKVSAGIDSKRQTSGLHTANLDFCLKWQHLMLREVMKLFISNVVHCNDFVRLKYVCFWVESTPLLSNNIHYSK